MEAWTRWIRWVVTILAFWIVGTAAVPTVGYSSKWFIIARYLLLLQCIYGIRTGFLVSCYKTVTLLQIFPSILRRDDVQHLLWLRGY